MTSTLRELEASIVELESLLSTLPAEDQAQARQNIALQRQTLATLRGLAPPAGTERTRPPLGEEARAFFTPAPAAPVPVWLPDSLLRADASESMMRPTDGAHVYAFERSLCSAFRGVPGQTLSINHGLTVSFHASTGRLEHQRFFERGALRWTVDYHPNGQRALVGFYADTAPSQYLRHGLHTATDMDGVIKMQSSWNAGVAHGWTKRWEDDGYPAGATLYDGGRATAQVNADGSRLPL